VDQLARVCGSLPTVTDTPPHLMRFRRGETVTEAVDRVTREQFAIALGIATADTDNRARAVHSSRKAIKRLRSVLRLVRGVIAPDRYDRDNQMLKLIAAELGGVRDAWVMAETLNRILPATDDTRESMAPLMTRLQRLFQIETREVLGNDAQVASIVEQLENVERRSRSWTVRAGSDLPLLHEFASIKPGLEQVYKRGRHGMKNAIESPTDTLLHNWRKRAKYLRHQIEALNVLHPESLGRSEAELEMLSDLLGDDHDLAVLTNRLEDDRSLGAGIDLDGVAHAITDRRSDLQKRAVDVGAVCYSASADEFLATIRAYWVDGPAF